MALSDLFKSRRKEGPESADTSVDAGPASPTKALPRFLASLSSRDQPLLLDLGPVVGDNVTFFGEQLGCKIFVEDVAADIERHTKEGRLEDLPAFFSKRFPQADNTFDGILAWDIFDHLDKAAAQGLATQVARMLKPDGVMLGLFNSTEPKGNEPSTYTKHFVVDSMNLKLRPYPASRPKRRPILNRDIIRMFEPLRVIEQFLLKTNVREVVFRK